MFLNATKEKLHQLKFKGMLKGLEEQLDNGEINNLSFEERFSFLVDKEYLERENRRLTNRLRQSRLKESACIEDIDFKSPRGIEKSYILSLSDCEWIRRKQNIIISGSTGAGKTYLASALANKACREGFSAAYHRIPRLCEELAIGKGDGRYIKLLEQIAKVNVLILDDWGLMVFNENQRRDILEIVEDRYNLHSTIIVSQVPVEKWYEIIGEPTVADAIMDRLIHNAHKIEMKGSSMRKKKSINGIQKDSKD